jgi:uncharacterized protein (TIGR03084 family)
VRGGWVEPGAVPGGYPWSVAPGTTLADVLDDLGAEHRDLDALVCVLDEAAWDLETPAPGWAVRDQISHLAFFDEAAVTAMTDPAAFGVLAEAALAGGDPMQEHLRRGRAMAGVEVLAWWRGSRDAMVSAARSLPPAARIPWFGPPMGALSFASARLMETWAHGQDVSDALGVRRIPTSRLRHIAHLGVRSRPFSYVVRGLEPPVAPVRVALAGPSHESWVWDERDAVTGSPPDVGADVVDGPALDFCLVVTQRRHVADTDLVVEGAAAREWMAIAQAFAGPPGPGRPARGGA